MTLPAQNTPEWLEWRRQKIGASDIPVIMELSPYQTPLQLWRRKLGFDNDTYDNPGMAYGRENERRVRERMQVRFGVRIDPVVCVHPKYNWAIASLDGLDEQDIIYEIKSCNAKDHEIAKEGKIPEKYFPQLQWQMFVTGLDCVRYVSSHKDEDVVIEVEADQECMDKCFYAAEEFRECLLEYNPPPLSDRDYMPIDDPDFGQAAANWIQAKMTLDEAKKQEKYWKDKLVNFTDDSNCEGYGVRLTRVNPEGSVDWSEVCKEYKIKLSELDRFKKPQIGYWRVSIKK